MARRLFTTEEIERANAAIPAEYHNMATASVTRISRDDLRRWNRIQAHPAGRGLFDQAMRLSEQMPDVQLAADIFEHIARIYRRRKPPGKAARPHDPTRDQILLALLDLAREGNLPGQARPWSKPEFVLRAAVSGRFGGASAIDRRLTRLVNERNKRTKGDGNLPLTK